MIMIPVITMASGICAQLFSNCMVDGDKVKREICKHALKLCRFCPGDDVDCKDNTCLEICFPQGKLLLSVNEVTYLL